MKLFNVGKVGCFCDGVSHSIEKRHGDEVKILTLTLRVAPFDAKLASALPDGVRATLFKLNNPDPKETLRRVDFALGVDRQVLTVFAAPDTMTASIAFDQVKIAGTYARTLKDRNGYDFVFRASFGPVGREELEFVQQWLLSQRFVTFEQAEPGMFDDDSEAEDDDADPPRAPAADPMFDGALGAAPPARKHQTRSTTRGARKTKGSR
jgi:hypothetical protein